jgi:adhesin transport system outer membrane protein
MMTCCTSASALTLEQSVAQAMSNNPRLLQKYARFEAKYKDKRAVFSDYLPQVSLYAATGYEKVTQYNGREFDSELNRRELGLRVTQSLFSGFKTRDDVDRLNFEMLADKQALAAEAENVSLEIAQIYLELLRAQGIIELSQENVTDHKNILTDIQHRADKGLSSDADVAQVQARLSTSQASFLASKNNYFDLKAQYYDLVGSYPDKLHTPSPDKNYLPKSLALAIDLAVKHHPQIKSATFDISAADKQISREKSDFWPKLDLALDINSNDNTGGFEGGNDNGRVMLTMSYDLFSGGRTRAKSEAAAWRKEEAKAIRNNTYQQVVEGTTLAWNAYKFIGEQKVFYRQNVTFATKAEAGYGKQFAIGRRSLLDVLDSKIEVFIAKKNFLQASFGQHQAGYRLINATGKLVEELRIDMPQAWQLPRKYSAIKANKDNY